MRGLILGCGKQWRRRRSGSESTELKAADTGTLVMGRILALGVMVGALVTALIIVGLGEALQINPNAKQVLIPAEPVRHSKPKEVSAQSILVAGPATSGSRKRPAGYYVAIAAVKERYGMLDEAGDLYRTAIELELSPQSKARYLCLAGNVELRKKQLKDAKELFDMSISLLQNRDTIERLRFSIAGMYANTGYRLDAKTLLEQLEAGATNEAMRNRARQLLLKTNGAKGGVEGLIHRWEAKLKDAPDNRENMRALAEAYAGTRSGREKALPLLDRLIAIERDSLQKIKLCSLGAKTAKSLSQHSKAVSYLDTAIKYTETKQAQCKYHFLRAESLSASNKINEAAESYRLVEMNSSNNREKTLARNQRLLLAKRQKRIGEAGAEYIEKLKSNSKDTEALSALVHLHWGVSRNAAKAKPFILSLAELKPKDAQTLQMKADIHNTLKEYDDALVTYQQALSIYPANKQFYLERMSLLYRRLDKDKEAVKCVDDMAKGGVRSCYSAGRIANLYLQLGEVFKGENYYLKAITLAKSDKEKNQTRLQAASALTNAKEASKARAILETVIKESKSQAMVSHAKSMLARLK